MLVLQEAKKKMRQSITSLRALQVRLTSNTSLGIVLTCCSRMNRACDYSDATPPPTSDDFNALKIKVMQLEATLHGRHNQATPYTPSSASGLATAEGLGHQLPAYNPHQDISWQSVQNRFPAIAFLDGDTFKYGGYGASMI